jgi:pyruvate dehydrogenase E2 component (dihydrolipoamide acetyltransferase)
MAKEVTMPMLSPSMTEGTLVRWLKKEGDAIQSGEVIAEVETDKATMDLESFDSGTLRKILVAEGSRVPINTRIAIIIDKGETVSDEQLKAYAAASATDNEEVSSVKSTPSPNPATETAPAKPAVSTSEAILQSVGRVKASPLAKKLAQERGINLASVTGSGPGGRIVKNDILLARASGGSGSSWSPFGSGPIAEDKRQPLSNMRQTIARRLVESKTQNPHFYLAVEINAGPLLELRAGLNKSFEKAPKPLKLSVNDFIVKAVAETLRRVPKVNASFEGDAIHQFPNADLSIAVSIPEGLITPIIREAQNKNIRQISEETKSLAAKAREGKLKPEEYVGGTFTISNLGMYGIDSFSAIINPPQAAILAVGSVVKKPVVNDQNQIVVGERLTLTLSCDHRVVDGALGALFLSELRGILENPAILLL